MLAALRPDNSPFSEDQVRALQRGFEGLDAAQSQWLSGYLAGRLATAEAEALPPAQAPDAAPAVTLSVLSASETGNGTRIAAELAAEARRAGLEATHLSLERFRPADLRKLERVAFVVSTHGEGDPPDEALDLFEYLEGQRAPRLEQLHYTVLALGDRSYEHFCAAGRRLDERLRALGARPLGERVECDVDFADAAERWRGELVAALREEAPATPRAPAQAAAARLSLVPEATPHGREHPFEAEVLRVQPITGEGSPSEVCHLELSLEGSGMRYRPGDALGVWAPNDPALVDAVLARLDADAEAAVTVDGRETTLADALGRHRELTRLSADTVAAWARAAGRDDLATRFAALDAGARRAFVEARQFADLADEYPGRVAPQALVDLLRPLAPRSYSIASSQARVDDEVHLAVATRRSDAIGVERLGVASSLLNRRLAAGDRVRVFPEPNPRFRLPEDDAPLILVGAGTGVAPYRGFLQQLEANGEAREAWLVFGNPHLATDFLYQREWLAWRGDGLLRRIDAAWSRDGAHKRYVQHVLAEQAARLARWLERGAHFYVCGGRAMGEAVLQALAGALGQARGLDAAGAADAVAELRRTGRLHKDLY